MPNIAVLAVAEDKDNFYFVVCGLPVCRFRFSVLIVLPHAMIVSMYWSVSALSCSKADGAFISETGLVFHLYLVQLRSSRMLQSPGVVPPALNLICSESF